MTLPPLATVSAFETRLGQTLASSAEIARAEAALWDASTLVRADARLDWEDSDPPDAVRTLVLRVARRLFVNPDGYAAENAGSVGNRITEQAAEGLLTDGERRLLNAALRRPSLGTVRTPSAYEGSL